MRWLVAFIVLLLVSFKAGANIGLSLFAYNSLPTPDVVCNIRTGVATGTGAGTCASPAATCDGNPAHDDNAAFASFQTWAVATWQASHTGLIQLYIPSGSVCMFTDIGNSSLRFTNGIKQLFILGTGATLSDDGGVGNGFFLGALSVNFADDNTGARTQTVAAGATTITLVTAGDTSQFTVGRYAIMQGIDLAGGNFGQPQNPALFEFVLVTAKDGGCAGSGTVCIGSPLQNTYKSTWPVWQPAVIWQGGPATLVPLADAWNTDQTYYGLTLSQVGQIQSQGRHIVYRNVTTTDINCIYPTVNLYWAVFNSTLAGCHMESDKIVDTLQMDNVSLGRLVFQNGGSNNLFLCNRCTATDGGLGTPKRAVITNSTMVDFSVGAIGTGATQEVVCTNCIITGSIIGIEGSVHQNVAAIPWTISSGTLSATNQNILNSPDAQAAPVWGVPNANVVWSNGQSFYPTMQIGDLTQSGASPPTNGSTNITTSLSVSSRPAQLLKVHPAPRFTCHPCSGSPLAVAYSGGVAGAPMESSFSYSYAGVNPNFVIPVWGAIGGGVTITVNTAYAGASSLNFNLNGPNVLQPDRVTVSIWNPTINPKVAGTRVITSAGVTCDTGSGPVAGACSGDSITAPGNIFFINDQVTGQFSSLPADICSANPGGICTNVTLSFQTDQGVIVP